METLDLGRGRVARGLCCLHGVVPVLERSQFLSRCLSSFSQLGQGLGAVAPFQVGEPVELRLDLLQASRIGLERREEAPQLRRGLPEHELGLPQGIACRGELRRQPLERRNGPLGSRHEIGGSRTVVRREGGCSTVGGLSQLGHVSKPLAVAAQLVFHGRVETGRVLRESLELHEASLRRSGVPCQLVVRPTGRLEVAPRALRLTDVDAGERVEHTPLIGGPREAALLELAAHRQHCLGRGRHVLAGGAPAPGVRAGPAVGEDPAGEHDALLAGGTQLGE